MDIYLVRHGEAASSWGESSDPGLSELGKQQAERVSRELLPNLSEPLQLITSPLRRAQETGLPLARELGKTLTVDTAYSELPSPVALAQRQSWLREFMQQRWDTQPEDLLQWRNQSLSRLLELDHSSVIFTHFMVLNAIVGQLQGHPETLCFWPDNTSVTHLRSQGGSLQLLSLGQQMKTVVN